MKVFKSVADVSVSSVPVFMRVKSAFTLIELLMITTS